MKRALLICVGLAVLACGFQAQGFQACAAETDAGPLAAYVSQPDASYTWTKRREGNLLGASYVELTLTSQTWHGILWRHQLYIIKPHNVENSNQALLMIAGGRWRDELAKPAQGDDGLPREGQALAGLAAQLRSPVALLLHVPQQPILGGRSEDDAIAHTFEQYLRTGDPTWPLLLPMVKSAVRAMDAVQEFAHEEWELKVENFTVTGGSKRGWTTWLTGAVDARANAIAPMVIDVLNMNVQMRHQLESWGKYSEQIADYTERGLQQQMDTEGGRSLNAIVDPYNYRHKITQPKLLLIGTNDRYWPIDALNLYWHDLEGPKYVLYVPNNGHGLNDYPRVLGTIGALHLAAAGRRVLPKLSWELDENGEGLVLKVRSDVKPVKVSAWTAASTTRDFRESPWKAEEVADGDGVYRYTLPTPAAGYAAMFGEAVFQEEGDVAPFYLSTNVRVIQSKQAQAAIGR